MDSGGSRAAKKRAKKRKQQQQPAAPSPSPSQQEPPAAAANANAKSKAPAAAAQQPARKKVKKATAAAALDELDAVDPSLLVGKPISHISQIMAAANPTADSGAKGKFSRKSAMAAASAGEIAAGKKSKGKAAVLDTLNHNPNDMDHNGVRVVTVQPADLEGRPTADEILADAGLPSDERARELLGWLCAPVSPKEFMARHFEQQPLVVKRNACAPEWLAGLLSTEAIAKAVKVNRLAQGQEVSLTKFDAKKKKRLNYHRDGEVLLPKQFNQALSQGLSVRLLCPQKHHDMLWRTLQVTRARAMRTRAMHAYWMSRHARRLTLTGQQG